VNVAVAIQLSGGWREALMGVSGNEMGTPDGNPQRHPCTALWHRQHVDAQMVVADGVSDPTSHDSDGPESKLSPASVVEDQTDQVCWKATK
jgi:hypothetical protein